MPIPPPAKQILLSLLIEKLHLRVPQWVGLVVLAISIPTGAWMALGDSRGGLPATVPPETPPAWSVGIQGPALGSLATAAIAELPVAIHSQRVPPCDPDLERPIRGACWVPVDVEPCPRGKAYVHDNGPGADGKCYARAMKAARSPTSGDPRSGSVADP